VAGYARHGAGVPAAGEALQPISDPYQGDRVLLAAGGLAHALPDVAPGDGAVGADVVGRALGHLAEHRAPDLHRVLVVLDLDAPRPVVAGAALDRRDLRARDLL